MSSVYFGAKTSLNRFAFLRPNADFIKSVIEYSGTRLVFYLREPLRNGFKILAHKSPDHPRIVYFPIDGSELVHEKMKQWAQMNAANSADLRLKTKITAVFLGLDEEPGSADSPLKDESVDPKEVFQFQNHSGVPLFAVDITDNEELCHDIIGRLKDVEYLANIDDIMNLSLIDSSIFSYGKMYLDWLYRNQYCPGCGSRVIPIFAGSKLQCTNEAKETDSRGNQVFKCPVRKTSVNNVCFPRQDPVVIIALRNSSSTKILLGHNARRKNLDEKFFSCFSGFMEPGETIEGAVEREVWEETGFKLHEKIQIVKSQPWPFPCCLMVGCVGTTDPGVDNEINIHLDKELDVCKWFDIDYVANLVYKRPTDGKIRLPYAGSVAFELIKMVIDDCKSKGRL
ncbi:hypothetical protein FOA43_002002 [Brettanomyces nanus]|uniref:NAD(+) diphosphatase n=1 Tax=Eeniella nana TaxID=13502 RepID=A0A875RP72_EENNA|nr:uncharacterized protein FOA43_002002 [Brettanomyces nanus]QPG74670.1 hypothetical protein FOA43_002002 [Brettanomyces nanus]